MYITCFVIPVPKDRMDAYREWARMSAEILKDFGCVEVVEAVGDALPVGRTTDFFKAVKAEPGEEIVLAWKLWPDKRSLEAGEAALHASGRLETGGEPPFDASRLIVGCFQPIFTDGRTEPA